MQQTWRHHHPRSALQSYARHKIGSDGLPGEHENGRVEPKRLLHGCRSDWGRTLVKHRRIRCQGHGGRFARDRVLCRLVTGNEIDRPAEAVVVVSAPALRNVLR